MIKMLSSKLLLFSSSESQTKFVFVCPYFSTYFVHDQARRDEIDIWRAASEARRNFSRPSPLGHCSTNCNSQMIKNDDI